MKDPEFSTLGGEFFTAGREVSPPPEEKNRLPEEQQLPGQPAIPAERVEYTEEARPRKRRRGRSRAVRAMATAAAAVTVALSAMGMTHEEPFRETVPGDVTGLGLSANDFYQVEGRIYFIAFVEAPEGHLSRERFPADLTYRIEKEQGSGWQVNDRRGEADRDSAVCGNEWLQIVSPAPDAGGGFSEPKSLTVSADGGGVHEEMTFHSVNWEDVPELECLVNDNRISAWPGAELRFENYLRIPQGARWKWEPLWNVAGTSDMYQGPIQVPDYSAPEIRTYMDENGFLTIRWFVYDDDNHRTYNGCFYLAGGGSGHVIP